MAQQLALLCLMAALAAAAAAEGTVALPADTNYQIHEGALPRSRDVYPVKRYAGHLVVKVVPTTKEQLDGLFAFLKTNNEIDVWKATSVVDGEAHLLVSPEEYGWVASALEERGLKSEVIISDVQRIIDNQTSTYSRIGDAFGWESYHRLSSMYSWMYSLTSHFPGVATLVDGGLSGEGRHMVGVRIAHAENLPIVFLEAGIHGREWIAPAVATYILNELLTSTDPQVQRVARSFEWHVFPSVNPDAYEYSHTTDRLWRKSRKRTSFRCYGADLNRNFPFHWGVVGVSWNPCSDTFPGTRAASEVETHHRIKYMEPLLPRMKAFIALHSYSQLLLLPYGDSADKVANYDALVEVGTKAVESFTKRHGTKLTMGTLSTILYPAAGSSMDWAYSQGVPFAYTYELRPSQNSSPSGLGFLLPANQILPAAEETTDSVVTMLTAILDKW